MLAHLSRYRAIWSVAFAAIVCFLIMRLWLVPAIEFQAGGMRIFDGRLFGYTDAHARQFLAALTPEGRALYLGTFQWVDTLFPLLNGLLVFWLVSLGRIDGGRLVPLILAVAIIGFDLMENHLVRAMLTDGVAANRMLINIASWVTIGKWLAYGIGYLTLVKSLVQTWRD